MNITTDMKHIFLLPVLLVAVLTSCSENIDEEDLTLIFNNTWNVNENLMRHDDGSITYDAIAWGGLAASLHNSTPINWKNYNQVVFEFATPPSVSTQVMFNGKGKAWGSPGIYKLHCSLRGEDLNNVTQLALQAAEPGRLEIKRIYLNKQNVYVNSTSLWEGTCIFGNWANGFVISADRFADASEGDRLEFIYTTDSSNSFVNYWQFKTIYSGTEHVLEGNADDLNEWGTFTVDEGSTQFTITLTANDVAQLKEHGLFVNGYYAVVSQCNLLQREE